MAVTVRLTKWASPAAQVSWKRSTLQQRKEWNSCGTGLEANPGEVIAQWYQAILSVAGITASTACTMGMRRAGETLEV
jgi:hypothetical protein